MQVARVRELVAKILFIIAAGTSVLAVVVICLFLFANGIPAISEIGLGNFLTGLKWKPNNNVFGILPMIVGSLYATAGAIALGVPVGLFCAVFLSRFAGSTAARLIKPCVQLLAGIPSVVYGFFGLVLVVPFIRETFGGAGQSLLAAIFILAVMILPTIITVSEASLNAVPESYYQGAVALGADHERAVFRVVVPAALSGIMAGIILGVGRAIGETMAVIMIAGNQPRIPDSLLDGVRTLTVNIALEMGYATDLHREALIATGCVLFVFILIINLCFALLKRKEANRA